MLLWTHVGPSVLAAFLASLVEFTEAMTVVLAVGAARGWRGALAGSGIACVVLAALVALLGPALAGVPLHAMQGAVGTLLLLFGMRWLRKAVLRAAGAMPLRDEAAAYARQREALGQLAGGSRGWDGIAVATAFKITMIEGIEVVFIVIAVGAAGHGLLLPASAGALAALAVVVLLGVLLHRPLAQIPENTLKLIVGILLTGFGTFLVGEGMGLSWPGADWSVLALLAGYAAGALITAWRCRALLAPAARHTARGTR